jgi:hypothetical protein
MLPADRKVLQDMRDKIDRIETLAQELASSGKGLPVIEKNARMILTAIYLLKFGVSDVVELDSSHEGLL